MIVNAIISLKINRGFKHLQCGLTLSKRPPQMHNAMVQIVDGDLLPAAFTTFWLSDAFNMHT